MSLVHYPLKALHAHQEIRVVLLPLEILRRVARQHGRFALRKDYVLVLLFMKYVYDKYADQPGAPIEVLPGGRFADMVALRG